MAEKDPYNIRTQYLPEFAYFSVPQVAKILGTSRTNAKEIIYGGVAEYLLDLHRQRNGHPPSTVREFTESFVKRSSFEKFNLPPELEYLHYRAPHTDAEKIALYEHPLGDEIFQTLEGRPVISKRGLDTLASTPFADSTPRAINVRARAGRLLPPHRLPRNPGRSSIGWNWQTPEPEASNAIRQWWPVLNKYTSPWDYLLSSPWEVTWYARAGFLKKPSTADLSPLRLIGTTPKSGTSGRASALKISRVISSFTLANSPSSHSLRNITYQP